MSKQKRRIILKAALAALAVAIPVVGCPLLVTTCYLSVRPNLPTDECSDDPPPDEQPFDNQEDNPNNPVCP